MASFASRALSLRPAAPPIEDKADLLAIIDSLKLVATDAERDDLLETLRSVTAPCVLTFVNAHAINLCWRDADFRRDLADADIRLRDGIGMAIALRALGREPGLNMNGTDLIPDILRAFASRSVAFFGSELRFAAKAASVAAEMKARPVAIRGGFEPDTVYVDIAARTRPELVILGMGMPKQERVALLMRDALAHPCVIVAGGAILDFLSGRFRRAPYTFRRFGLEWLYRLAQEPRRLAFRYLVGSGLFLWRVAQATTIEPRHHAQ